MIRVSNKACVRHLGRQSMKAAKTRNCIAVLAIALTTVLFTSLFTIALSINDGFQQSNFRQAGGYNHATFKSLTQEQFGEIKEDPLIKEWGLRRFIGMPTEAPFHKSHVEIGYSDPTQAKWMFCQPQEGRLPQEGTNEAATDTRVLELLGVEPVLGAEFTLTFGIGAGSVETTQTFTLCGWWEYDEAIPADHVLIPESRLESILAETGYVPGQDASGAGLWGLDVMLDSSLHIEQDVQTILANHGYQDQNRQEDNYVNTGVNWGYTGAKMAENMDPATLAALAAVLLLIVFTGYLIIYNVFQISVTNDIRFYGLLKTIGTTGRQIKALLRQQALLLSCIGIPIGLVLGWMVGGLLAPMVIQRLDGVVSTVSVHPLIFVGSALFALFTVLLSCAKPGRLAAKVSPIEAVRYTEGSQSKKKAKRGSGRVSPFSMARANLGRSKGKTVVTVLSLSLAVVLTTITATFVGGFDMDKYLSKSICTDFVLADAGHFQVGDTFHAGMALPQEVIDQVTSQGGVAEGGKVYGMTTAVQEGVTEDWFRSANQQWYTEEQMESLITGMERDAGNHLLDRAQLYGMEGFALDQLDVMEGDLSKLYEPGGRYIAAVYNKDDYGKWRPDSHWAKVGDQVTLRYVSEFEYYSPTTGEVFGSEPPEKEAYLSRAVEYQEVTYEVAALVAVPSCLGYGYYGADEFVLNDATFCQDTQSDSVMLYAFNTQEGGATAMEDFLADYTENQNPQYDYVSKVTYQAEFESFRAMFPDAGRGAELHCGAGGRAELLQRHFDGHPDPEAGVCRAPVHRHDRAAAEDHAGLGGPLLRAGVYPHCPGAGPGAGAAVRTHPGEPVLVLHLSSDGDPGSDSAADLSAAGRPGPAGGLPVGGPGLRGGAAAGGGGLRRCPVKLHNRSEQTGPIPQDRAGLLMAFWQSRREGAKIARKRKQGEHKTMKSPESEKKLRYFFRSA